MAFPTRNMRCVASWCRLRKTKSKGMVDVVLGMFMLLMVVVMTTFAFRVNAIQVTGEYVEDALAGALLSAAVVDVESYGRTGQLLIDDPNRARGLFLDALSYNLSLEEGDYSDNEELVHGRVSCLSFQIYQVKEGMVERITVAENAVCSRELLGPVGSVRTPDGTWVENPTIYGKIGFYVKGMMGESIYATKEKSVDIIRNEEETDEKTEID